MTKRWMATAGLATVLSGTAPVRAADEAGLALKAGAAKVDITPPASTLEHGDAIRDHLYVRAIVVSNGATCAVLVGLDQGNAQAKVVEDASRRAAQATGCPAENFLISATHTHSANTRGLNDPLGRPTAAEVTNAIVAAVTRASARLQPARIGFGTTEVAFNTNRDLFEGQRWYQGINRSGPSDKTLGVVEFLGTDGKPIGVYMNYAMHPINFYLSGQISADVPGEASRYVERRYPEAVAVFTQGASGDQNPLLIRPMLHLSGVRTRMPDATNTRIDAADQWKVSAGLRNANADQTAQLQKPLTASERADYQAALAETSELVTAMGVIIGESAIDTMRNLTPATAGVGEIWAGQRAVTCPARERIDQSARQGELPPYRDAPPVSIKVGLLRIAGVNLGWVNGEVYSQIGMRVKREAPDRRLMLVTLGNGRTDAGYIASDEAGSHLTFQVIGAKLKPGCAETGIVDASLSLLANADTQVDKR